MAKLLLSNNNQPLRLEFIKRSILSNSEKLDAFELWNNEYPEKLTYKSTTEFDEYLENLVDLSHILLIDSDGKIRGWYFDFIRDNGKWFAIILDSKIQGNGFGTKMLNLAKENEIELNGWVIDHNRDKKRNGKVYKSPLDFYLKNGFKKISEIRLELDKISAIKIKWKNKN